MSRHTLTEVTHTEITTHEEKPNESIDKLLKELTEKEYSFKVEFQKINAALTPETPTTATQYLPTSSSISSKFSRIKKKLSTSSAKRELPADKSASETLLKTLNDVRRLMKDLLIKTQGTVSRIRNFSQASMEITSQNTFKALIEKYDEDLYTLTPQKLAFSFLSTNTPRKTAQQYLSELKKDNATRLEIKALELSQSKADAEKKGAWVIAAAEKRRTRAIAEAEKERELVESSIQKLVQTKDDLQKTIKSHKDEYSKAQEHNTNTPQNLLSIESSLEEATTELTIAASQNADTSQEYSRLLQIKQNKEKEKTKVSEEATTSLDRKKKHEELTTKRDQLETSRITLLEEQQELELELTSLQEELANKETEVALNEIRLTLTKLNKNRYTDSIEKSKAKYDTLKAKQDKLTTLETNLEKNSFYRPFNILTSWYGKGGGKSPLGKDMFRIFFAIPALFCAAVGVVASVLYHSRHYIFDTQRENTESTLTSLRQSNPHIQTHLDTATKEYESIADLTAIDKLEEKIDKAQSKFDASEEELKQSEKKLQKQKSKIDQTKTKILNVTTQLRDTQSEIVDLKYDTSAHADIIARSEQANTAYNTAQAQVTAAKTNNDNAHSQLTKAQIKSQKAKALLTDTKAELVTHTKAELELEKTIKKEEKELESLTEQIASEQQALATLEKQDFSAEQNKIDSNYHDTTSRKQRSIQIRTTTEEAYMLDVELSSNSSTAPGGESIIEKALKDAEEKYNKANKTHYQKKNDATPTPFTAANSGTSPALFVGARPPSTSSDHRMSPVLFTDARPLTTSGVGTTPATFATRDDDTYSGGGSGRTSVSSLDSQQTEAVTLRIN
jgi:hypothetical protein